MRFELKNNLKESELITLLINRAYRGTTGKGRWTTENHLVDGERVGVKDIENILSNDIQSNNRGIFITGYVDEKLSACLCIERHDGYIEFGKFAVDPDLQGQGYGDKLLTYGENIGSKYATVFHVSVVSQNMKLINFYKQRGYVVVEKNIPYPVHLNVGKPKMDGISLTLMRKFITVR